MPNTSASARNRDRRFWVVRTGTPTGWFAVNPFLTGANAPFTSTQYQFRTGDQLRAGSAYASSGTNATFMLGTGNTNNVASGGIWQSSRNNPSLPATCGLSVALVLDVSGSVASSLASLKTAAKTFTNSLVGTPSQVGALHLRHRGPGQHHEQPEPPHHRRLDPDRSRHGERLDRRSDRGGSTNWDRGIDQVAESGTRFDIAIVITDGNPTFYGNGEGPGNFTRLRELENGIFSANTVKAKATRMIAVGVGAGVSGSPNNLISISGPTANSDYFQTNDYTAAGAALRALALGACQGTISVVKQVVPSTAPPGSITGAVPAGGWQFGATTTTSGVAINPTSGTTAAASGALNFNLSFPGGTTTAPVTVTETQQAGYTLVQQGGLNATCRRLDTNAAVTVTNSGATGFLVTAATAFPVSCTVYNRAPSPAATIVVNKKWLINGQSFDEGTQPSGFDAALTIGGAAQGWGAVRTGFQQGDSTVLNETVTLRRLQCTLTSSLVTLANGTTVSAALPFTATLVGGANSYTVTNTVTCNTRLTLVKEVHGSVAPTAWTLNAAAPAGALPGPSGTTGATAPVTPGATYTLSESGGDPRYLQKAAPGAVPIAGSTVSWSCVEVDAAGVVIPGFSDGLNGGVTVPIGTFVRCTAINETATLRLIKKVVNDNGGTAVPGSWQLTATPVPPVTPGLTPVNGHRLARRHGVRGATRSGVRAHRDRARRVHAVDRLHDRARSTAPDDDHHAQRQRDRHLRLHERRPGRPPDARQAGRQRHDRWDGDAGELDAGRGRPDADLGHLGVRHRDQRGGQRRHVHAVGVGRPGRLHRLGLVVHRCDGDGQLRDVPSGGNVTCTITNTAVAPQLTLVKQVDNGTTGGTATPANWTLAAAGPTPFSGVSGTPAVTAVPVAVGTYTLSESGGPAGYTASAWSCVGVTAGSNGTVTLEHRPGGDLHHRQHRHPTPPHAREAGGEHLGWHGRAHRLAALRGGHRDDPGPHR